MQVASSAPRSFARPTLPQRLAALGATLRTWRARACDRCDLARMDERERNDLPFARDIDIRSEITKPFWRD